MSMRQDPVRFLPFSCRFRCPLSLLFPALLAAHRNRRIFCPFSSLCPRIGLCLISAVRAQANDALYHSRVTFLLATNSFVRRFLSGRQETVVPKPSPTGGRN